MKRFYQIFSRLGRFSFLFFVVTFILLPTTAFSTPDWDDIYYKKAPIAKGWKYIIIHHSATDSGTAKGFDAYHTKKRFAYFSQNEIHNKINRF